MIIRNKPKPKQTANEQMTNTRIETYKRYTIVFAYLSQISSNQFESLIHFLAHIYIPFPLYDQMLCSSLFYMAVGIVGGGVVTVFRARRSYTQSDNTITMKSILRMAARAIHSVWIGLKSDFQLIWINWHRFAIIVLCILNAMKMVGNHWLVICDCWAWYAYFIFMYFRFFSVRFSLLLLLHFLFLYSNVFFFSFAQFRCVHTHKEARQSKTCTVWSC